ncbi:MAG: lytic transglycosylase domain-containing protein [Clostridia bacterium]|nr:lytic transglycosylase domain-containing protein [Clostridia bacterium]
MSEKRQSNAKEREPKTNKATKRRRRVRKKRVRYIALMTFAILTVAAVSAIAAILVRQALGPKQPTIIVAYEDLIRENAEREGLEPAYVAAVVMAESSYQPDALSSDNAQGLMQLLPSTAEWIAGKLNETYLEGSLFVPEVNLRYGCWYLGWLMQRYDHDMRTASSAYFQGQGTVDNWLTNPELSQNGRTLVQTGTAATETYVNRILRYYERYKEIYAEDE